MPEVPVTLNVLLTVVLAKAALDNLQLPVLVVVQVVAPPGLKVPDTLALGAVKPVLTSRTLAVTNACQLLFDKVYDVTKLLMATVCTSTTPGAPLANE